MTVKKGDELVVETKWHRIVCFSSTTFTTDADAFSSYMELFLGSRSGCQSNAYLADLSKQQVRLGKGQA